MCDSPQPPSNPGCLYPLLRLVLLVQVHLPRLSRYQPKRLAAAFSEQLVRWREASVAVLRRVGLDFAIARVLVFVSRVQVGSLFAAYVLLFSVSVPWYGVVFVTVAM